MGELKAVVAIDETCVEPREAVISFSNMRKHCRKCMKQRIPPMSINQICLELTLQTLESCQWNRTWAAEVLAVSRRSVFNYINELRRLGYYVGEWEGNKRNEDYKLTYGKPIMQSGPVGGNGLHSKKDR